MTRCSTRAIFAGLIIGGMLSLPSVGALAQMAANEVVDVTPVDISKDAVAQVVKLPQGKAKVLRLPADARDVLVANPGIADIVIKTPRMAYLVGRTVGATNAFFFDEDGDEIVRLEVQVEVDVVAVQQALSELIPSADINVKAVRSDLFLTGNVRSNDMAANAENIATRFVNGPTNVVNMIKVSEDQQVLLQVRIAEVSRGVLKNLGVDLAGSLSFGDFSLAYISGNIISTPAATPGFGAAVADYTTSDHSFQAAINALESNGLVRTLAEPNLTAISGETANFLAGGEIPIPVAQETGVITITFRQFGVGLNFTPVVLNSGRISLRLSTEVSTPDSSTAVASGGVAVPGFSTRRAETTIEIPSGGSLVIAGLLQDSMRSNIEGLPYLKDIPILGPFFRTNSINRDERELVVAVTAYLVRPIDHNKAQYPTKDTAPPTDYELFFLGRLEAIYGDRVAAKEGGAASLKGPIGYIVQ